MKMLESGIQNGLKVYTKSRVERKTVVSQMVVFPQTLTPHHKGNTSMKIATFPFVNNENFCIVYKGVKVAPKQGFQKYIWVMTVLRSTLEVSQDDTQRWNNDIVSTLCASWVYIPYCI